MFFDPMNEFPHVAILKEQTSVPDGIGGEQKTWAPLTSNSELNCFIDTPSTDRLVEASKLNIILHRDLFCHYGTEIQTDWRIEYDGQDYEISGDIEDQGGMHEVVRIPLKRV